MDNSKNACCFSGHRGIPIAEYFNITYQIDGSVSDEDAYLIDGIEDEYNFCITALSVKVVEKLESKSFYICTKSKL